MYQNETIKYRKIKIDNTILDNLSAQAKTNPRLRQSLDLRTTPDDQSQRMLNALEPGTVMPIHRHRNSSETMVMIRGSLMEYLYDDEGNLIEEILMKPNSANSIIQLEKGQWHSLKCLELDIIIFEAKDGAYEPISECDIIKQ